MDDVQFTPELIEEVRTEILALLGRSTLVGARLVPLLRERFRDLKFGAPNPKLSEFIKRHVPEAGEIAKSGPDSIYGLIGEIKVTMVPLPSKPAGRRAQREMAVLRAFSSPYSKLQIMVNAGRRAIRVVRADLALGQDWVDLPKLTPLFLEDVARGFVTDKLIDETAKTDLMGAIGEPEWWVRHRQKLVEFNLLSQFGSYRGDLIRRELDKRLEERQMPPLAVAAIEEYAAEAPISNLFPSSVVRSVQTGVVRRPDMRSLAAKLVESMSIDQLRALPATLGMIFDIVVADREESKG